MMYELRSEILFPDRVTRVKGIERLLAKMEIGEKRLLDVPFRNGYWSKRTSARHEFEIEALHWEEFTNSAVYERLTSGKHVTEASFKGAVLRSLYERKQYAEFVKELNIQDVEIRKYVSADEKFQRVYCLPRTSIDTAKAIYRLMSIGIIDDYTIDYQKKLYRLSFTKYSSQEYLDRLEALIGRYTSPREATRLVQPVREDFAKGEISGNLSAIGRCLEFLTGFVYGQIRDKRRQAISDIIELCDRAVTTPDPLAQNLLVKEDIFYYFNAKYAKPKHQELIGDAWVSASMPEDHRLDHLTIEAYIEKYLDLVDKAAKGRFIENIKHLRGAAQRMLRAYPGYPQYHILKAYSMLILSNYSPSLLGEAVRELIIGMQSWSRQEPGFSDYHFLRAFKERVGLHTANNFSKAFDEVEDAYYAWYYAEWLTKFNQRLNS